MPVFIRQRRLDTKILIGVVRERWLSNQNLSELFIGTLYVIKKINYIDSNFFNYSQAILKKTYFTLSTT